MSDFLPLETMLKDRFRTAGLTDITEQFPNRAHKAGPHQFTLSGTRYGRAYVEKAKKREVLPIKAFDVVDRRHSDAFFGWRKLMGLNLNPL